MSSAGPHFRPTRAGAGMSKGNFLSTGKSLYAGPCETALLSSEEGRSGRQSAWPGPCSHARAVSPAWPVFFIEESHCVFST